MADKGIFIKILGQLEMASFAAAINRAKGMASNAARDIDRDWASANKTYSDSLQKVIASENDLTKAAEARSKAESDVEIATQKRVNAEEAANAKRLAALRDLDAAEANAAKVSEGLHTTRIAQLEAEAAKIEDVEAAEARLAQARKLRAADEAAIIAASNRTSNAQDRVDAADPAKNSKVVDAVAAENAAKGRLSSTNDDLTESQASAADAADQHRESQIALGNQANQTNRSFNILGGTGALLGLGFLDMGKKAADFQQKIITLQTAGGELANNLHTVSQGILDLSTKTGQSSSDLADAMLMVEKAGYHGADALKVLTVSTQTAISEHADLKTVVDALTTSFSDYHTKLEETPKVASQLVAMANETKKPLQDIAGSFYSFDPTAMRFQVPQDQVLAMLSSVVRTGMNPQMAGQDLTALINTLGTPSQVMRESLGRINLNADDLAKVTADPTQGPMSAVRQIVNRVNSLSQDQIVHMAALYQNPELQAALDQETGMIKGQGGQEFIKDLLSGKVSPVGLGVNKAITGAAGMDVGVDPEEAQKLRTIVDQFKKLSDFSTNLKKGQTLDETKGQLLNELLHNKPAGNVLSALSNFDAGNPFSPESLQGKIDAAQPDANGDVLGYAEQMAGAAQQLQQATKSMQDAAISIGTAFAGPLKGLADGLKGIGDFLTDHPDMGSAFGWVAIAAGGVWGLSKAFRATKLVIQDFMPLFEKIGAATDTWITGPARRVSSAQEKMATDWAPVTTAAGEANNSMAAAGTAAEKGETGVKAATTKEAADVREVGNAAQTADDQLIAAGPAAEKGLAKADTAVGGFLQRNKGKLAGLGSILGMLGTSFLPDNAGQTSGINDVATMSWLAGPEVGVPVTAVAGLTDAIYQQDQKHPEMYDQSASQGGKATASRFGHANGGIIGFHKGGVLPGYSPGKDNLLGMVNGKPVGLSGGEGILVPEAVRALGPSWVDGVNAHFTSRRPGGPTGMAGGGLLGMMADSMTNVLLAQWGLPAGSNPWAVAASQSEMQLGSSQMSPLILQGLGYSGGLDGWIQKAVQITGVGSSWIPGLKTLIGRESGGNPIAQNNVDSNAAAGQPSQGLMQTIPSTFAQYALPGLGGIKDPVANIVAGIRYIQDRYGDISQVQQANPNMPPKGYADGTSNVGGQIGKQGGFGLGTNPSGTPTGSSDALSALGLPPLPGNDEQGAQIDTIMAARAVHQAFPQISDFGLYRAPDGYNEHSSGEAADCMIPNYDSPEGKQLGNAVAQFALQNAAQFGVKYVLWQQRQWNPDGTSTPMEDRGSPTQNHMDHVHIRTEGGGFPQGGGPGPQGMGSLPSGSSGSPAPGISLAEMQASGLTGQSGFGGGSGSGMPSMLTSGSGMSGFGGVNGSPGLANPLEAAGSGGFSLPNLARLLTTFLMEEALGNPLGRLAKEQMMPGGMPGTAMPGSPGFAQNMGQSNTAMSDNLTIQRDMTKETNKSAIAWDAVAKAQDKITRDGTTKNGMRNLQSDYITLDQKVRAYQDTLITAAQQQDNLTTKSAEQGVTESEKQTTLSTDQAKLKELQNAPSYMQDPAKIAALQGKIKRDQDGLAKLGDQMTKTTDQLTADNNVAAEANPTYDGGFGQGMPLRHRGPLISIDGGPGTPTAPTIHPTGPSTMRYGPQVPGNGLIWSPQYGWAPSGPGIPLGPGPSVNSLFGPGPGAVPTAPGSQLGGPAGAQAARRGGVGGPPGLGIALSGANNPQPTSPGGPTAGGSQQPGIGNTSPGFGVKGGVLGAAEGAASMAASATPAGPAGGAAMDILTQEANRFAGYVGQIAGIGVEGLLETFSLNDSSLADPSKSWLGKIATGIAGAHPSNPNTAGQTQPPLKKDDGKDKGNSGSDNGGFPGINIENQNFYGNDNSGQVNREQNRNMMQYTNGAP